MVPEQPVLHLPAPQSAHLEQVPALLKGLAVPQEERHWPAGQLPQLLQEPALAIPVLALVPQLTLYLPAPQESQLLQDPTLLWGNLTPQSMRNWPEGQLAHVAQEPPVKEPAHPVRYLPLPQFPQLEQPPPLVWGHAVPQEERHWVEGHEPQLLHLPALRPEHEERYLPVPHVAHRVQEP